MKIKAVETGPGEITAIFTDVKPGDVFEIKGEPGAMYCQKVNPAPAIITAGFDTKGSKTAYLNNSRRRNGKNM